MGSMNTTGIGRTPDSDRAVRQVIELFYAAFDLHSFYRAAEFITGGWDHIDPLGRWAQKCTEGA